MKFQDFIIKITEQAAEGLFQTAKATPAAKLDWLPLAEGRSIIDILGECAQQAGALNFLIPGPQKKTFINFAEWKRERQNWTTVEECQRQFNLRFAQSREIIKHISDGDLDNQIEHPWITGQKYTVREAIFSIYWQLVYHDGQINYIQTLYGDKVMH